MKEFIKKRLSESFNFKLLETLMDEDYPSSFDMEKFKSLKSFNDRIRYCEEHLSRISSGSSRIVYKIDNLKVLKLAKNKKGIAQNETEIQWGQDRMYSDILAHTYDSHPNGLWVEMELARQVNLSTFKNILKYPMDELCLFLKFHYFTNVRYEPNKSSLYKRMLDTELDENAVMQHTNAHDVDYFYENPFSSQIASFMSDTDSPSGDFCRTSSFGVVKRDGQDTIVIIDFGLTTDVYDSYYS